MESMWVEFRPTSVCPVLLIGFVYRNPDENCSWIGKFEDMMDNVTNHNPNVILLGDFNIDLMQPTPPSWESTTNLFGLEQLVTVPTRVTKDTATLLDHIYTNNTKMVSRVNISDVHFSDHSPIICTWSCKAPKLANKGHTTVEYRSFKHFKEDAFLCDLHFAPLDLVYQETDVNQALNTWYNVFLPVVNKHAPLRKRRVKHPSLPGWLNQDIMKAMKERDKLKKEKQFDAYKKQRNRVLQLVRNAKKAHFSKMIQNDCDTTQLWRAMNEITHKSRKQATNHTQYSADTFNNFFLSTASSLPQASSHAPHISPLLTEFCKSKLDNTDSCEIPEISVHEVHRYIKKLKNKKSMGPDNISAYLLKLSLPYVAETLAHIYNLSINQGIFPHKLKDAKVIPLPKSKDPNDPNDYRPISLLSVLSKPLEKHIHNHMNTFLESHSLFHDFQSGFRQKHSCHTALVRLCDTWLKAINDHKLTGAVFLDFKKAFDMVNHTLLEQKLNAYLQNTSTVSLLKSFLCDRMQRVYVNGAYSSAGVIQSGVPQGSVLGPLLFCIFINDLPKHISNPDVKCDLFADDSSLHTFSYSLDTVQLSLQQTLNDVSQWCEHNKMVLHPQKTKCMVITTRQKHQIKPLLLDLQVSSEPIEQVASHRVLGITIDNKMQWQEHAENICKKVSRNLYLLKQLRYYVDSKARKLFFHAHCMSRINYASTVWSQTADTHLVKLNSLHRRGAKLISSEENISTTAKLRHLDILPLASQFNYNLAILVFKVRTHKSPVYLKQFLITPTERYGSLRYLSPTANNDLFETSFGSKGANVWNSLPTQLKYYTSLARFKTHVKKHFSSIPSKRFIYTYSH